MTKIFEDEYCYSKYPQYVGVELIPVHWHPKEEDYIYCEVKDNPELGRYFMYLDLEDWQILEN
jgi:hypothetical protein